MNPEIYTILEDMKNRCPKNPIANSDIQTYLQVQSSKLLILLAEEAEISAKKTENATRWMVRLTWAIAILTGVLVLTLFFTFPKIAVHFDQKPYFSIEKTHKANENNPTEDKDTFPLKSEVIPHVKINK